MDIAVVRKALEHNFYQTHFVKTKLEALDLIKDLTKNDITFSNGGSMTLREMGVIDYLTTKGVNYYNRDEALKSGVAAYFAMMQKANTVDVFLSSVNAITENGYLYNVDANGNHCC